MINEQIKFKQRFFIPTDESKGVEILTALLKTYPVMVAEDGTEASEDKAIDEIQAMPEATPNNIIDLEQWIIPAGEIEESNEPAS